MKHVLSIAVCTLLLFPSLVFADGMKKDDSTYVSLSGMVAVAEDSTFKFGGLKGNLELDTGFGISVAAGKKFGNGWRGEAEYSYQHHGVGKVEVKIEDGIGGYPAREINKLVNDRLNELEVEGGPDLHFFMVNGVYDILNSGPVTPYLGVGIGLGWEEEADRTEFAYQLLAGISYEVSSHNELIFGYRYRGMTDLDYEVAAIPPLLPATTATGTATGTTTADSHNFEIGFRHSF